MTTALDEIKNVVTVAEKHGITVSRSLVRRRIKFLREEHGRTTEQAVGLLLTTPEALHSMEPLIGRRDPTGREASLRADGDLTGENYGFIPTQRFHAPAKDEKGVAARPAAEAMPRPITRSTSTTPRGVTSSRTERTASVLPASIAPRP